MADEGQNYSMFNSRLLVDVVGDVVKEGDEVSVKVVGFDRGKVKLSMKQASA